MHSGKRQRFFSKRASSIMKMDREKRERKEPRTQAVQLGVCLALFLTVFIGKGILPEQVKDAGQRILETITADVDFQGAFAGLGESLAKGNSSLLGDVGEFCVQVFGAQSSAEQTSLPDLGTSEMTFLASGADCRSGMAHYLGLSQWPGAWQPNQEDAQSPETQQDEPIPKQESTQEKMAVPEVGTVLKAVSYSGTALPERYTMDMLALGELETVTPVLGTLTSAYGYREHPVDGEYRFHNGVDIGGVGEGADIVAFASGTVEYVGESDAYGLYFQLDHGNGVKSFYAHCSQILVHKGEAVEMGQLVAKVGSTGNATGPHLHLELKCGGMHVNPLYYIQTRES